MNDPDQAVVFHAAVHNKLPATASNTSEGPWDQDGLTADEEYAAVDPDATLASLGFIVEALKRNARLWCAFAVAGLVIGLGLYVKFPPAYQASTFVLVKDNPTVDATVAIQTDAALAHSLPVAERVVHQLGLPQSASSFLAASTVTVAGPQLLQITVNAPSSSDSVSRTSALAAAFLQFHADYVRTQQQQLVTGLNQQISQAQQRLNSINEQISRISAEPGSADVKAKLASLEAQRLDASNALAQTQQYANGTLASTGSTTSAIVLGSGVLDTATPVAHSHLKSAALYVGGGLIGGLVVGMGIVVISALVSDRLRRRDDIANALGAPVRLSVGAIHARRRLPGLPWRTNTRALNMRRIVAYLRTTVPGRSQGPASLAVVAIDDTKIVARAIVALAVSYASQGKQVVVADLSDDARVARLLGQRRPGVHAVRQNGAGLVVTVPDPDDIGPVGPLSSSVSPGDPARVSEALVTACRSADLVLTLATLTPAFGADHLATWATDVVAVVTAGRSSVTKIRATGEMIRIAGMQLDSVVLIGADKSDESLGVTHTSDDFVPVRSV